MSNIALMQKYTKIDALLGLDPEFERSDRAEILRVGRYKNFVANERLDIPKHVLAERLAINTSRF